MFVSYTQPCKYEPWVGKNEFWVVKGKSYTCKFGSCEFGINKGRVLYEPHCHPVDEGFQNTNR